MIISVRHSGTRTLLHQHGLLGKGLSHFWHFGEHDAQIEKFTGHADVPIRNAFDILASWRKRGLDPNGAIDAIRKLIRFVSTHPDVTLHVTERAPVRITDDHA